MEKEQKTQQEIAVQRNYFTIKANELVRARYALSVQGMKLINFMISRIKPDEDLTKEKTFEIKEFYDLCGITDVGGSSYQHIKMTLKAIADKSVYVPIEGGVTLVRWLSTVDVIEDSGTVTYKFFERMIPYIHQLKERFTKFPLIYTLPMTSQYSIRLYELFKSYESLGEFRIELEELKKNIDATNYVRYPDFRRFVVETALNEINEYSDLSVEYEPVKQGRKVVKLKFFIQQKTAMEKIKSLASVEQKLDG